MNGQMGEWMDGWIILWQIIDAFNCTSMATNIVMLSIRLNTHQIQSVLKMNKKYVKKSLYNINNNAEKNEMTLIAIFRCFSCICAQSFVHKMPHVLRTLAMPTHTYTVQFSNLECHCHCHCHCQCDSHWHCYCHCAVAAIELRRLLTYIGAYMQYAYNTRHHVVTVFRLHSHTFQL